ncbi:hypothetical protein E3T39_02415 [Cryobacterium suzukii]|uniref:Uncharacterized protein n=1 Tax=Cryobacterium suzukii TaxID=1259198 RepID=A0A4V3ISY8_9MICO|nr:hypothetical protein E3T39_02415 [Cryobacterium suzukii]
MARPWTGCAPSARCRPPSTRIRQRSSRFALRSPQTRRGSRSPMPQGSSLRRPNGAGAAPTMRSAPAWKLAANDPYDRAAYRPTSPVCPSPRLRPNAG